MPSTTEVPVLNRNALGLALLLLLCLEWAWNSVRTDLFPGRIDGALAPLMGEAVLFGVLALLAAILAFIERRRPANKTLALAALVGLGMFVVPAGLTEIAGRWIDAPTRVALFSLTPVFAIVFEPHLDPDASEEREGRFAASLVAVTGALLVFPITIPRSATSALAAAAVVLAAFLVGAANTVGVRACRQDRRNLAAFSAVAAGVSAGCLAALGGCLSEMNFAPVPFTAASLLLGEVALLILFPLMRLMSAVEMTTRFLIAPWLANLIALTLLRPRIGLDAWAGMAMIIAGAGWLLIEGRMDRARRRPTPSP